MSARQTGASGTAPSGLPAALDLLARVRAALAAGDGGRLHELAPLVDRLRVALEQEPRGDGATSADLLALLDEVARLSQALGSARAQAREALRDTGARERAGAAYHRAGRL